MWWLDEKMQSDGSAPQNASQLANQSDDNQTSAWPMISQPHPNAKNVEQARHATPAHGSQKRVVLCFQSSNDQPALLATQALEALKAEHAKELAKAREVQYFAKTKLEETERLLSADILQLKAKIKNLAQQGNEQHVEHAEQLAIAKQAQQQAKSQLVQVIRQQSRKISHLNALNANYEKASIYGESVVLGMKTQLTELKQVLAEQTLKADREKQVTEADFVEARKELIRDNHQMAGTIAALKQEYCELEAKHKVQLALAEVGAKRYVEAHVAEAAKQNACIVAKLNRTIAEFGQLASDRESAITKLEASLTEHKNRLDDHTAKSDRDRRDTEAELTKTRQRLTEDLRILTATNAEQRQAGLEEAKQILNANNRHWIEKIASLKEESHRRDADHFTQLSSAQRAQKDAEARLEKLINEHDGVYAQLNASIEEHARLAVDRSSTERDLENKLAEQRILLCDQIAIAEQSTQVAETILAESESRFKADNQQLIEVNVALKREIHELESACIARLALAHTGQQQAETRLAETLRQSDETVQQLNSSITKLIQSAIDSERVVSELNCKLAQLNERLADQMAKADQERSVANAKFTETEQRHHAQCQRLNESIATLSQQAQELDSEYRVELAHTQAAQQDAESRLVQAVKQYDNTVAQLKLNITELDRLASDRDEVIREQAAKLAEDLGLQSDLIAKSNDAEKTAEAKLIEVEHRLESQIQSLNQRLAEALMTESDLRSTLRKLREETEQQREQFCTAIRIHSDSETRYRESHCRTEAEADALRNEIVDLGQILADCRMQNAASVAELNQTREQLQEQLTQLQKRLQREAAGRRKVESAMKLASEVAPADSVTRMVQAQIDSEQRSERLTRELESMRLLGLRMQQKAIAKIQQSQKEIGRLRLELEHLRPRLDKQEAA